MPGPDIDFERIRPYGRPASRPNAFEELSSILLRHGVIEWPTGTRFQRFGNPDGGREGRGVLPNGDVWAWQSKYLFTFDASAAAQISSSVKRVLESEPNLKRYFVTLPIDLSAGDTETRGSAQTRWDDKVSEWKALATQRGMDVEFHFVGAHELTSALTLATNEGRARYWFDADVLTEGWQRRRLGEAVAKAGRRYTPKIHVEVHTVQALHAVGRADPYLDRWRIALAELREARRWCWRSPRDLPAFDSALARCSEALAVADTCLATMIATLESSDNLPAIDTVLSGALAALGEVDDLLHEHCLTDGRYFVGDAGSLASACTKVRSALWQASELARSALLRAADTKRLVITGRAGNGKTHLFCDVATQRISEGRPTLLVLGQDFDARNLLPQFAEITQLNGGTEAAIASFAAAAEASGHLGLVMIDALNESERPERWRDDLRTLLSIMDRYEHVAVTVSCRTEFVDAVLGDDDRPTVEHPGFAEATDRAISRYTEEYGLEPASFPVLGPEFSNPLYLKLTCEALRTLGATRFPFGSAGVTTVCEAFLDAVNRRLAEPSRCDYDETSDAVAAVVRELASLGGSTYDRADVRRLTESVLPGDRGWSRSLLRGLIAEGVLIEVGTDRIAFGYQRLGDLVRATRLAEDGTEAVRAWFDELGDRRWQERGLLGALAVVMPEQHGVELFELVVDDDGKVSRGVADAFLESLLLRGPDSITPPAVTAVQRLLDSGKGRGDAWEVWGRLLRIACIPGHPLNAGWLHEHLRSLDLADRDATWSQWLIGSIDDDHESPVRRLLDWAWPEDLDSCRPLPDDVASLATTCLGWLLTTTDRRFRDRATKALTSIAERAPVGFATGLARFAGINDPYVTERLAGAACGAALRTDDEETIRSLADGVSALLADCWPDHLLTRDYAHRVVETARAHGWAGSLPAPAPGAWPMPVRPAEEINALAGAPDYAYSTIWHSLTGIGGDFGRYILKPALEHIAVDDEQKLARDVERAVFERVLDLGWTPERFKDLDRARHGGHDGVVERVGKKYQWIAFYEVLGRLTDHHLVRTRWRDDTPRVYEHAEQLIWRDIDPTVLVRKPPRQPQRGRHPWFAPVAAEFPDTVVDEYPSDMTGVPDPLDLLAITDADGTDWLTLIGNHTWEQPLPVEVVAQRGPRLVTWMHLRAYLVPTTKVDGLTSWAQGQDWYGRWMPDTAEIHNVLLGAHPDGPGWKAADGAVEWWPTGRVPPPCELQQCALWYGGTGTDRDASAGDETRGFVPTRPLIDALGLSKGCDFRWRDPDGLAVHDPSVVLGGRGLLVMRRDLASPLQADGVTVFWTVLLGCELRPPDHQHPGDEYRWISASASYVLDGDSITRVHSLAKRCRPGPVTEHDVEWVSRAGDP
ncbi:NACHT domain-containing protein [Pseudonocardia sp. CA-107938]|uniref:NACHT domain-containing protein n=1 Tax=Pseudonocardia sp. CA-107938 TaxID=3240021 RepID=UPI003D91E14B